MKWLCWLFGHDWKFDRDEAAAGEAMTVNWQSESMVLVKLILAGEACFLIAMLVSWTRYRLGLPSAW